MISLSLGSAGGNPAFKVSYSLANQQATIQYGTMNINSYFVASNPVIGTATVIGCSINSFVYLQITDMFIRTKRPTISFFTGFESPDGGVATESFAGKQEEVTLDAKPFPTIICLGYIDGKGKVFDLRPVWVVNVFSFLG